MGKSKKGKVVQLLSPENYIEKNVRKLPIYECLISNDWTNSNMPAIFVARKHSNGNLTVGSYLIDLNCLGVRNTSYYFNLYPHEYDAMFKNAPLLLDDIPYIIIHNIIYSSLKFAESYGFKPHPDFAVSKFILEEDNDDIEFLDIPCGINGIPVYEKDVDDTSAKALSIISQLEKTAGKGNFRIFFHPEDENVNDELKKVWFRINVQDYDEHFFDDWDNDQEGEDDDDMYDENGNLWDEHLTPFNYVNRDFDENIIANSITYQFKIKLKGLTKPPVWRTIQVPSYYNFLHFHVVIQLAFGWNDSHLFQFSEKGYSSKTVITHKDEDFDTDVVRIEAEKVLISDVFTKENQTYQYIYDFGDSWEHVITLEKIIPESAKIPQIIAGKGACPPENCGGAHSFKELKQILSDPNHPKFSKYAGWMSLGPSGKWDPNFFDLEDIQLDLNDIFYFL